MESYPKESFNLGFFIFSTLLIMSPMKIVKNYDEFGYDMNIICRTPNMENQTRKGFSYIGLKISDHARRPPLRVIDITTENYGYTAVIIVASNSVKGQGGRSVPVKGTNGVGKGPNDELTLNSDQRPDPHTRGTGSSTVGLGKIQVPFGVSKMNYFPMVLAGAGIKSKDDVGHEDDDFETNGNLDVGDGDTGEGSNDKATLNSDWGWDEHPDPHNRGTGSPIFGCGNKQVFSGDDDDFWRKNFTPPLAGAAIKSKDDVGHEVDNFEANGNLVMGYSDAGDSEGEYYKQVEQRQTSRTLECSSSPEPVDGNHRIIYQMENSGSVQGPDSGATPDIDWDFDLTPHIGRTGSTTADGIPFSQASNSVESQEASSSGQSGGNGARSGSESDQSTGSGGTGTDEGISRRVDGDEHDSDDRDDGNDEDRRRDIDLERGTRRVRNPSSTRLVAIFTAVTVQSTSAIIALSLNGLSPLARNLFTGVLVTNLVAFLCLFVVLFRSHYISPGAANILGMVGAAAAAFGFLLMMGIKLSVWIIILACLVVLAASVLSFMP